MVGMLVDRKQKKTTFQFARAKEKALETRFLESLLNVAKHGSIAEAARHQGLTPAAVGQRIQALEAEIGFPLVERVGHRSRPTEACLRILPHARSVIEQVRELGERADVDGLTGRLRIGAISTLFQDIVPPVLRQAGQDLPGLRMDLTPGTSKELYAAFGAEEIDVAMIVAPPFTVPKETTVIPLLSEPLVLISSRPERGPVAKAVMRNPYLRYDNTSWGGIIPARYLEQAGVHKEPLCNLDSLETIAILVREGMGASLVPAWKGLERFKSSIFISEPLPERYNRQICLVTRTKPRREPLLVKFTEIVQNAAQAMTTMTR